MQSCPRNAQFYAMWGFELLCGHRSQLGVCRISLVASIGQVNIAPAACLSQEIYQYSSII